jgi:hypothetical protein
MILAEIAAKNVIRRDFDLDGALDIFMGPVWSRLVIMRAPLPEDFSRHQAEHLLKILSPN